MSLIFCLNVCMHICIYENANHHLNEELTRSELQLKAILSTPKGVNLI